MIKLGQYNESMFLVSELIGLKLRGKQPTTTNIPVKPVSQPYVDKQ